MKIPKIRTLNTAPTHIDKTPATENLWGLTFDESSSLLYATESRTAQLVVLEPASGHQSQVPAGPIPYPITTGSGKVSLANFGEPTFTTVEVPLP